MRTLFRRWRVWWAQRWATVHANALGREVESLREQLETERVKIRIQQVEIDHLTAALARGLDRWEADLKANREER